MNKKISSVSIAFALIATISPALAVRPANGPDNSGWHRTSDSASRVVNPTAQQLQAENLLKSSQPAASVNWDSSFGTPSQVSGKMLGSQSLSGIGGPKSKAVNTGTWTQRALAVMDNVGPLFRLKDAASDFKAAKPEETDKLGFRHQKLEQVFRGIPVVGGGVTVHFDASGAPYRIDGRYVPDISVQTVPTISSQTAIEVAKVDFATRGFGGSGVLTAEQPELVVYARGSEAKLAYELVLQHSPANAFRYWVDAATGQIVATENRVCHIAPPTSSGGTAKPLSGNVLAGEGGGVKTFGGWSQNSAFYMYSPTNFYFVYNNAGTSNNAPSAPAIAAQTASKAGILAAAAYPDANTYAYRNTSAWGTSDPIEVSIAANMQATFGYYQSVHGRSGYNGAGKVAPAVAHYGNKFVNAFWDGAAMYFGDGDGMMAGPLAVTDICAHELTHAVTETTANLVYSNESGALNESFSDIFGALVEFNAQADGRSSYPGKQPGKADWLVGEDCWLASAALRDLRNPSSTSTLASGSQQPSKYKGTYWQDYTKDKSDNGGVHQNSGVQNFFFYLLCEGGSGNNGGIPYTIAGIGINNAQKVAYRALSVYCTPSTDYKSVQNVWITAAQDLDASWVPAVKAAWRAAGIGITSPLSVQGRVGSPLSYRIAAPDQPSSYSAAGLPPGLSFSGNTISGSPTLRGEYGSIVSATTGGVTFSDTVRFSIVDASAPDVLGDLLFPTIKAGTVTYRTISLRNVSKSPLAISAVTFGDPAFQGNWVPRVLAPRTAAQLTVAFRPAAVGNYSTTADVIVGGSSVLSIPCTGAARR